MKSKSKGNVAEMPSSTATETPAEPTTEALAEANETINKIMDQAEVQPPAPEPPLTQFQEPKQLSVVDEVLALQKQLDERKQSAIDALLEQERAIKEQLSLLGFTQSAAPSYRRPPQQRSSAPAAPRAPQTAKVPGQLYCRYCNTHGSHDARAHRGQAVKKAFSASELSALKA